MTSPRLETLALALQTTVLLWLWWRQSQSQSSLSDQVKKIQVSNFSLR
jgi:hypothetical protein